ncbi:MAG: DNA polymerase I [Bacteroidia bacterium]|nr:DNA polymerase I [Bacteroidia bacterium]
MNHKKLLLIDAYSLIYRSYFAFIRNPRYNSKGMNTSAIFGFINTLDEALRNENPSHIAIVFDPPGPTFRHKVFPEYKANRQETPEDIKIAVPYIKKIAEGLNIPIVEVPEYEADDVIGTLAKKAEHEGFTVYILSPDKDFCQLVSSQILIYKPRKGDKEPEKWGIDEVKKNFMVPSPENVIDVLGLMGDSSDNIPGAPGIGEVTAKKLINSFGSIQQIYQRIDELKGKQKEIILNFKEQIMLSKELVTISLNAPIYFNENEYIIKEKNNELLTKIFEELEFKTLAQRILSQDIKGIIQEVKKSTQLDLFSEEITSEIPVNQAISDFNNINTIKHDYYIIDNEEERNEFIELLLRQNEVCFDTETTGIDPLGAELVGISFCFLPNQAYYIPVPPGRNAAMNILNIFSPFFENSNIKKIGQNIKYDILVLSQYGIKVVGELFDTMIAHYLIQPELKHNLDYIAEQYLKYKAIPIESLIGKKGKSQSSMRNVPVEKVAEYSAEDADITFQLKSLLETELNKNSLNYLFYNVEMPLLPVLVSMEMTGVKLNIPDLVNYGKVLQKQVISIEETIYSLANERFNISSPKQLGEVLFNKLKIDPQAVKTKTNQYSTSEDVLVRLAGRHPIVNEILDSRSIRKLLSTYIEALPELLNPDTGRVHTSFNQARVATGRLSSDAPNLQNIPVREERGREIRKAFIPTDTEHLFMSADYSQIELRIMAHFSKDTHFIDAFHRDEDIHRTTAAKIYNIPPEMVTKEMRNNAKVANFGIIYGITAFGLSQRLKIKRTDAKALIDNYFESFPGVKEYIENSLLKAREKGYVETILGRRRYLNDINSRNATVRGMAERNAINAPIQGSAADIIKIAMIRIFNNIKEKGFRSKMLLQVHDELDFDVYKPEIDDFKEIVKYEMENTWRLDVPLIVDIGIGNNWLEAH